MAGAGWANQFARTAGWGYTWNMENMLSRNVDEIPEASRRSLESLLGRQLEENQRVFIMVLGPAGAPSEATRRSAAVGLRDIIAMAERHMIAEGVSEEEADAAVTEAMEHVRRRAV